MTLDVTCSALVTLLVFSPGLASRGAALPGSTPITPEQIAAVMHIAGIGVVAGQIALPGKVTASTPNPELKVEAIRRWADGQLRVRIECLNRAECIPFIVDIHASQPPSNTTRSSIPAAPLELLPHSVSAPSPFLIRLGSSALLLLEGEHIRVQLPVICLENGRAGQTIHVTSKDGRHIYTAKVVSRNELKGWLE